MLLNTHISYKGFSLGQMIATMLSEHLVVLSYAKFGPKLHHHELSFNTIAPTGTSSCKSNSIVDICRFKYSLNLPRRASSRKRIGATSRRKLRQYQARSRESSPKDLQCPKHASKHIENWSSDRLPSEGCDGKEMEMMSWLKPMITRTITFCMVLCFLHINNKITSLSKPIMIDSLL